MNNKNVGLPARPFLYTMDQISTITMIPVPQLHMSYIFHENRDVGTRTTHQMKARNIAPPEDKPEWRVAEQELINWLRRKGFKFYDRGYAR